MSIKKILIGRASLIGDIIMSLPMVRFFAQKFPDAELHFPMDDGLFERAGFLLEGLDYIKAIVPVNPQTAAAIAGQYDFATNPYPSHPSETPTYLPAWWNCFDLIQETFRMGAFHFYSEFCDWIASNPSNAYPVIKFVPQTVSGLDFGDRQKLIAIWPFAARGELTPRSPSVSWWKNTISALISSGYTVVHCGHPKDYNFTQDFNSYHGKYINCTHLSLRENISVSLMAKVVIGTDSGAGWIIGAIGHPQITLLPIHAPNHFKNFTAFAPFNCKGNIINIIDLYPADNISVGKVLTAIKEI